MIPSMRPRTESRAGADPRTRIRRLASSFVLFAVALLAASSGRVAAAEPVPAPPSPVRAAELRPLAPTLPDSIPIGLPPELLIVPAVKDPVFGILIGLVSSGTYGTLTGARLESELKRQSAKSNLPYRTVDSLARTPVLPGRTALIKLAFRGGDLDLPIPYDILGYHPGSFTASERCVFREWILGNVRLTDDDTDDGKARTIELQDVHLFGLSQGKVDIDIDGWLDSVMGGGLDDTGVTCLMLCRHNGAWLGFAMGYNDDGRGRSGAFDFAKDEVMFPTPSELRTVGRQMRSRMESLMTRWVGDGSRAESIGKGN
jgi:hypothetical protein